MSIVKVIKLWSLLDSGLDSISLFFTVFQGITIDACVLGPYATLLSQGADITGGIYFKPPNGVAGLLQYLLVTSC